MTSDRLPILMPDSPTASGIFEKKLGQTIPRVLGEAAYQGYVADGHGSQSCERLHQRGGFGLDEIAYYLARAVEEGLVEIRWQVERQ